MTRLTAEAFDALATLLRMRPDSPTREASRKVFVEGAPPVEAAADVGIKRNSVYVSGLACREGIRLAETVVAGIVED